MSLPVTLLALIPMGLLVCWILGMLIGRGLGVLYRRRRARAVCRKILDHAKAKNHRDDLVRGHPEWNR